MHQLCNMNSDFPLLIECFYYFEGGSSVFIGGVETTVNELHSFKGEGYLELINPQKAEKKKKYKNSGTLFIYECQIEEVPTLLEYQLSGWSFAPSIAIDFSASSGYPQDVRSLHYTGGHLSNSLNLYEKVFLSFAQTLEKNLRITEFEALGFNGNPKYFQQQSDCFSLTPDESSLEESSELAEAYRFAIQNSKLGKARVLKPTIQQVTQRINKCIPTYHILLIIVDGSPYDVKTVKQLLESLHSLPISVVIMGVGEASFQIMDSLNLSENFTSNSRHFIQFIRTQNEDPEILVSLAIKQIPDQLIDYCLRYSILPDESISRKRLAKIDRRGSSVVRHSDWSHSPKSGVPKKSKSNRSFIEEQQGGGLSPFTHKRKF